MCFVFVLVELFVSCAGSRQHVKRPCFVCFVLELAKVFVSCASVLTYELVFMLCYAITLFCNLL
jgi:hypothetical protein